MVRAAAVLAICVLVLGCLYRPGTVRDIHYQARVDKTISAANVYPSIQAALDAAPAAATEPYRILVASGDYYEKLVINKPNIHIVGAGPASTRLYFDAYAGQSYAQGKTWGTSGSATLTVRAPGVLLQQLTIENTFDFLANDALAVDDPARIQHTQAVALLLDTGSDRFIGRQLHLLGYQDTLYINAGRSWFDRSLVAGNVDYIFGRGNALFTHSEIRTLGRNKTSFPHGYITAPSTQISDHYGLTFIHCKLTRVAGVPDNSVPLGRPWHPTTQFADGRYADPNAIGKSVFINTWMDAHITRDGWYSMSGTAKDGISKVQFTPEDSRFFEYQSAGPGAQVNSKRRQLSAREAEDYTPEKILGEWYPQ
ncbi:pectinesterase family protein [Cellvibrio japonicus]|uniref:Pectin methylesterase, putative, pme8C n=1 Tax=Cellvibrio japonicus (strain Ueda107) TaxID=498211 RepID=B3PGC6_CELJU|nr:pectinesterase family protein [Cellvibrio japonicus]ACE84027.1 pectin methylesterase, putative, pme8C [Cellvibrio japonicus Ueda107]QEI10923.1 pectin esterase [Cellvibrio japonicus]QEI14499.1 pectin esterase [Cellvibrio japonicus]QEI18077.1 pectin esterase [Cellvibrio japonicus]